MQFIPIPLQDGKDFQIRNLGSPLDTSDVLVDADEYLQPKSRAPLPAGLSASSVSVSPPRTPIKTCWSIGLPTATDSPTPQNQQNMDKEQLRYGNGYAMSESGSSQLGLCAHLNGHCGHPFGSDSSASRYCSDPLKMVGIRG